MKKMNNKGFSLIELIIVIAIMAVLVAIIAPNLTKYLGKSKQQTDKTNLEEIRKQVKNCISEATTDDISIQATDGTAATYTITSTGSAVTVTPAATGTTAFATLISDVLDPDTVVKSKAQPSKTSVVVTITGTASGGYTVTAVHS